MSFIVCAVLDYYACVYRVFLCFPCCCSWQHSLHWDVALYARCNRTIVDWTLFPSDCVEEQPEPSSCKLKLVILKPLNFVSNWWILLVKAWSSSFSLFIKCETDVQLVGVLFSESTHHCNLPHWILLPHACTQQKSFPCFLVSLCLRVLGSSAQVEIVFRQLPRDITKVTIYKHYLYVCLVFSLVFVCIRCIKQSTVIVWYSLSRSLGLVPISFSERKQFHTTSIALNEVPCLIKGSLELFLPSEILCGLNAKVLQQTLRFSSTFVYRDGSSYIFCWLLSLSALFSSYQKCAILLAYIWGYKRNGLRTVSLIFLYQVR